MAVNPEGDKETGRVTCFQADEVGGSLYVGSKNGYITVFNHESKKIKTVKLETKSSKQYKVK